MRVALVHDWLTGMRGGERVLEEIAGLFADAPIYSLLHVPGSVSQRLESRDIYTSFVQRLPRSDTAYRWYLPVFPWAIEQLELSDYELVISTSHCAAKAVLTHPDAVHLCYCHTPMRYAWDQFDAYFSPQRHGRARYWAIRATMAWLRRWDRATADRVDAFAANSAWVAGRIQRYYGRSATIIPPPVDTVWFVPRESDNDHQEANHELDDRDTNQEPTNNIGAEDNPYWLMVSALSPYKRVEVAIEAFNRMGRRLIIAGSGPEADRLAELAGPTVELQGWVEDETLRRLYQGCRGVVLTAVEDAGIVPLEAMACGRPAAVLARGGAAEAVIDGETGVLIESCEPQAVIEAIDRAESVSFNTPRVREHALAYSRDVFARRFTAFVARALNGPDSRRPAATPTSSAETEEPSN